MMRMMFEGVSLLVAASSAQNHQTLDWDSLDGMRLQFIRNYCDDDDSDFFLQLNIIGFLFLALKMCTLTPNCIRC